MTHAQEAIAPLLPPERPKVLGGRLRVPDQTTLTGIMFVLRSDIPRHVPAAGEGQRRDCRRRLRDWPEAGVWERLHRVVLNRTGAATYMYDP